MRLPVPNAEETEAFRKFYFEKHGVELTRDQALELATTIVHLLYVMNYGIHPLCPAEE